MFVACGIWCLADVSSVSPSSEQTSNFYFVAFDLGKIVSMRLTPQMEILRIASRCWRTGQKHGNSRLAQHRINVICIFPGN